MDEIMTAWNSHFDKKPVASELEKRFPLIEEIFEQPNLRDIFDALESNKDSTWAQQTLQRLKECSPLMLHVTFRLQKLGFYLQSLEEALALEFRVALNMLDRDEFYRGIKARIYDRKEQKAPQWIYPNINSVPNNEIATFFKEHPLENQLDLQPGFPGIIPSRDPFRVYNAEIQNKITGWETGLGWLIHRHIDDVIPKQHQTIPNIRSYYQNVMNEGNIQEDMASMFTEESVLKNIRRVTLEGKKNKQRVEGASIIRIKN